MSRPGTRLKAAADGTGDQAVAPGAAARPRRRRVAGARLRGHPPRRRGPGGHRGRRARAAAGRLARGEPVGRGRARRTELDRAKRESPDLYDWFDFMNARFELLDGDTEVLPGLAVITTPGHTAGHQSVVVQAADGTSDLDR